jgi:hypothetical protein
MKIATYFENRLGRNDGSPIYYLNALRNLGHEVRHFISDFEPKESEWGKFDLHMWIDWGEDALSHVLPYKPITMGNLHPSVYVPSDTHLGYDYRLMKAREFDHVFCNQLRAVEEFYRDGVKAQWLPHAVEPQAYPNAPVSIKKYDIGFVGFLTFTKRVEMLDRMFREFPNFWYGQRLFEECAEIYRKSRIVFNTAAVDDLNMRLWEATATGAFLLTEWVPTLDHVFEDGKHLVSYRTMDEAIEKAHYYLAHEDEREAIAKAGMEHTLSCGTYKHRIEEMLRVVSGQPMEQKWNLKNGHSVCGIDNVQP